MKHRTLTHHFCIGLIIIFLAQSSLPIHAQDPEKPDPKSASNESNGIKVVHHDAAAGRAEYWRIIPEARPPLLGFRAVFEPAISPWPYQLPASDAPAYLQSAADHVTRRLATDGLLPTLANVLAIIGPLNLNRGETEDMDLLRQAGLPVDLLRYYPVPGDISRSGYAVVRAILSRLVSGRPPNQAVAGIDSLPFEFLKSHHGFRAATESGEASIGLFRLQLARGDYWRGKGDGSSLDIARQLANTAPDARFLISVEESHSRKLLGFLRQWPVSNPGNITLVTEEFDVSEWAQDNGKPGILKDDPASQGAPATLVPRFASRGEEGTILAPGECRVWSGLHAAGHTVIQSPLLFQGGNLMLVADPDMGWRYLLIGEAEIYRNTALGLTTDQVVAAFKIEFDADVVVVLPAASYHIDYEVSVRARKGGLTAFVNDTGAAVKIILQLGITALHNAGVLSQPRLADCRKHLNADELRPFLAAVRPPLHNAAIRYGQFPESLARHFSVSLVDSGVGNFQNFLLALDLAEADVRPESEPSGDPQFDEYLAAIRRRNATRRELWRKLEDLRFKLVPIPSLADENRGLNHINGVHCASRYYMPGSGGFYADFDRIAADKISTALDPGVEVTTILCAESQRRFGAIHCAVSAYPVETESRRATTTSAPEKRSSGP